MDWEFHPASVLDLRLNLMMKVRWLSRAPAGKGATKRTLFNARSTDLSSAALPEGTTILDSITSPLRAIVTLTLAVEGSSGRPSVTSQASSYTDLPHWA